MTYQANQLAIRGKRFTGDLDTWDERLEAGGVALGTEGVWKVQKRPTVKGYDYEWEKWEYDEPYYYEELFPNVG